MLLLALAIAPGLAIILYIIYKDKFDREPAGSLVMSFVLGVLATVPALILQLAAEEFKYPGITGTIISTFFFVALIEEVCKFIPLRFYSFNRRSFNEPLDGIVYSVMIAMGFATLENIGYVYEYGLNTAFARMVISVPGHATFGVIMGYYAGKAKFDYNRKKLLLFTGLLLATFFHWAYDSFLFTSQLVSSGFSFLLVLGALASYVVALIFSIRLIRLHRQISSNLHVSAPILTIRNASEKDVPLIRTLATQVWPETYKAILSKDQISYMMKLMYSQSAIVKQMQSGHQFIIVYNAGHPVGFASYSEVEPTIYKLHKIYILKSQQGRGTGKFVIEQVLLDIRPKGATALQLNVNRNNKAKAFYEKLGFEVIRTEDIDIGNGFFCLLYTSPSPRDRG